MGTQWRGQPAMGFRGSIMLKAAHKVQDRSRTLKILQKRQRPVKSTKRFQHVLKLPDNQS